MKGLTDRQRAVLDIISASMEERGYPPTIREIGEKLGIRSTNGVNDHLKALERKGYLFRDKSKSRAIRLIGEDYNGGSYKYGDHIIEVPIVGRIAAGSPILAQENRESSIHIDAALLGTRAKHNQIFILKVRGESMIEDGIFDSDLIFVERTSEAQPGEIVAVLIDGEATVKRFYREGTTIRLDPANAAMEPIYIREDEGRSATVIGRVVGVFRQV